THAQLPVSWSRCGTDLQDRIQAVGQRVGADERATIVAADASSYLLRTARGEYWDLGTQSVLTREQVDELRKRYDDAWAEASTREMLEFLQGSWDTFEGSELE